jgi:hypothetical protein
MQGTSDGMREDLRLIGQEVMRAASEKFTGKMEITLHMKRGGIGQITVLMQKNLKTKTQNGQKTTF